MKIQLQFEDTDLEEMVIFYFKDKGFVVKNMEEIAVAFKEAFPDGLNVMAEVAVPTASPIPVVSEVKKLDTDIGMPYAAAKSTRALSITDLRDPEVTPRFPTRDEQLRQEQEELERVLQRSKELAKD